MRKLKLTVGESIAQSHIIGKKKKGGGFNPRHFDAKFSVPPNLGGGWSGMKVLKDGETCKGRSTSWMAVKRGPVE